jgi:cation:H+ antiporter
MMIAFYTIAFLVLSIALAKSADWMMKGISYFAHSLKIQSFLLSFLLLGIITSIPEMFVAFQSIADKVPQLSVGNLLGGAIFKLSFLMGISAILLGRIVLNHGMTLFDIGISAVVTLAPAVVVWDGKLTRLEGFILIGIYLIHIAYINKEQHVLSSIEHHAQHVKHGAHALLLCIGGLVGMAIASKYLVEIGSSSAMLLGIPPFVIGLFLITLGTNLPELTLATEAIMKKNQDIAFGDILGSSVISTLILGIVCVISPFSVPDHERMRMTLIILALVSVFFFWAASTKKDITRREGIVLFTVYIAFVLFEMLRV